MREIKTLHIQIKKGKFGNGIAYSLETGDIAGRIGMYGITFKEVMDEKEDRIKEKFEGD